MYDLSKKSWGGVGRGWDSLLYRKFWGTKATETNLFMVSAVRDLRYSTEKSNSGKEVRSLSRCNKEIVWSCDSEGKKEGRQE